MDIRISDWTKLGSVIRDARKKRGLSQHELASRAGVSRSWLARLETGHRGAELEPLFRLLNALDVSLALRDLSRADDPQLPDAANASRPQNDEGRPNPAHVNRDQATDDELRARIGAEKATGAAGALPATEAARSLANSASIRRATEAAGQLSAPTEAVRRATQATSQIGAATDAARKAQSSAAGRRRAWQDASAILGRSDVQEAIKRASRLVADAQRGTGATGQPPGAKREQPDHDNEHDHDRSSSSEPEGSADGPDHE